MIIAITGGFGTGKTTVANMFSELGGVVISADFLGHRLLDKKKNSLVRVFGKDILKRGRVDRKMLGKICFSDPYNLRILNGMIHPMLINEIVLEIDKNKKKKFIFVDAALYYELQLNHLCDYTIVVSAKKGVVEKRILKGKRFDKRAIGLIRKRQKPIKTMDVLIMNNGGKRQLERRVKRIWKRLQYIRGRLTQ